MTEYGKTKAHSVSPLVLSLLLALLATPTLLTSCDDTQRQCTEDEECPINMRCVFNKCEERPAFDGTAAGDLPDGVDAMNCQGVPPVTESELRINEVHTSPLNGADDSNCDGLASNLQDEFIEIVNNSSGVLSLDGIEVQVNGTTKHTLSGCLEPSRGLVLYSGGTAACTVLGGTQALVSSKSLSLSNSGTQVSLVLSGTQLDVVNVPSLSSGNSSWTRAPDFTGDFLKHVEVSTTRSSPGKCINGEELIKGCMPASPVDGDDVSSDVADATDVTDVPVDVPPPCDPPSLDDLVLNEVLFDPMASNTTPGQAGGDANCDGVQESTKDEFVEVVNVGMSDVNLKGVRLGVAGASKYTFTTDQCLGPKQALVFFGGGTPSCPEFADALVVVDSLGLVNGGSTVAIFDAQGVAFTLGTATWASNADASDQSLQRSPDLTGTAFVPFTSLITDVVADPRKQSPGTCVNGALFSTGCQ